GSAPFPRSAGSITAISASPDRGRPRPLAPGTGQMANLSGRFSAAPSWISRRSLPDPSPPVALTAGPDVCTGRRRRPAPARETAGDPGRLQVHTGRLAPPARRRLDAAERPAELAQRQDLLLLVVAQDVGHVGGETTVPSPPSTSWGAATSLAGFQVSTTGRSWVSTEVNGPDS